MHLTLSIDLHFSGMSVYYGLELPVTFSTHNYRGWSSLILRGLMRLFTIVQGKPISMFLYAVATISLINKLDLLNLNIQMWYADDASVIGDLH